LVAACGLALSRKRHNGYAISEFAIAADLAARFEAWREEMAAAEPRGPFRDY
jgi:hypothetical protein